MSAAIGNWGLLLFPRSTEKHHNWTILTLFCVFGFFLCILLIFTRSCADTPFEQALWGPRSSLHSLAQTNNLLKKNSQILQKANNRSPLKREGRAQYGKEIIKNLAQNLTEKYGKGFDASHLYKFVQFSELFHDMFPMYEENAQTKNLDAACLKSNDKNLDTACLNSTQDTPLLSWSHYRVLLQVIDNEARRWYTEEATREAWSVRILQRNISSQYYYRILKTQNKRGVHDEMRELTKPLEDPLEFIKSPVISEFLGLSVNTDYYESTLEKAIISNLQRFLMELGKGYAFVARQQHIHTEKEDYYIDLVFYNVILKAYVLVDLKTTKITYQDVGQMDMYVRMYDELKRTEGDNPTIGILLCADTAIHVYNVQCLSMFYNKVRSLAD